MNNSIYNIFISKDLTPLSWFSQLSLSQKVVTGLAMIALATLSLLYLTKTFFLSKNKIVSFKETNNITNENKKGKIKEEGIIETVALNPQFIKKTISQRIESNKKDAIEQQMKEEKKGFLMEEELASSIAGKPIFREYRTVDGKEISLACCEGRRDTMEDAHLIESDYIQVQGKKHYYQLFGVFDGHGGSECSAYVANDLNMWLQEALQNNNENELTEEGIFKALKECFIKLDAAYSEKGGTTATVAFIIDQKIWVANVGDSRTILIDEKGEVIQASEDAKPASKNYYKKIEKLGGFVRFERVNEILGVARAIGDKTIIGDSGKCCVSPNPKITCYPVEEFKNGYILLACDGLFDVASTNEVGKAIKEMVADKDIHDFVSLKLVYQAIKNGSQDNVTVMMVKL